MSEELKLEITRFFDAPASLVFDCWADGDKISQWSAPHGMTIEAGEGECVTGSNWKSTMKGPDFQMDLQGKYLEVIPKEKIVFTHEWLDADGKPGETTTITVLFKDFDGKCEMTFIQTGFANAESKDGHAGGWTECFEKLEKLLRELQ